MEWLLEEVGDVAAAITVEMEEDKININVINAATKSK